MDTAALTARKTVADIVASGEGEASMAKSLGLSSITAMGIGAIIGAGIFVLTGTAAAQYAGPAIMLSFVLGGVACAFVGLCYSELAAMLPVAGSSYTYTYATLGEIFAWIIGWDLILEYAMGAATVAVGWSGYVVSLLKNIGLVIPPQFTSAPGTAIKFADGSSGTALVNLPAVFIVAALTIMLIMGTKESARLNNIMVAVKLVVVVAFIASRRGLREVRQLASLHPAEHRRVRSFRLERHPARLFRRVLRLHRFRRGVDSGTGGEKPRRRTCRVASSARSSSARCSTSPSPPS